MVIPKKNLYIILACAIIVLVGLVVFATKGDSSQKKSGSSFTRSSANRTKKKTTNSTINPAYKRKSTNTTPHYPQSTNPTGQTTPTYGR